MRILIISDNSKDQINGVVTTLRNISNEVIKLGHDVLIIRTDDFKTIPCPTYPEIRLSLNPYKIKEMIKHYNPDAIHIATEGILGVTTQRYCVKNNIPFTTSFHTKWPEILHKMIRFPKSWTYKLLRSFHDKAKSTLVTTETSKRELEEQGFSNLIVWNRGTDTELFNPSKRVDMGYHYPIFLNVGRVSTEKNLPKFLDLPLPGTKIVVGDGPALNHYRKKYKTVIFTGVKTGEELAKIYASSSVFVFPSLSDTFGVVLIEALASGLPIAAYPTTGPIDVVKEGVTGYLSNNLDVAALECLHLNRDDCRNASFDFNWVSCAKVFIDSLHRIK